jgi:hypothetical protein|uniref:CPW-WPC domain-containing protein n=1 Tax=viral metagenome TaxID=1070528 RepID=A0A6C0EQ03_9ZZZZ
MEGFQKIVLFSAIIILIIALVIIGISLIYSKDQKWPPIVPACPDYWQIDGSGNNTTCTNVLDLGSCPARNGKPHLVMNFNSPIFSGSNGVCAKYQWANNCGISWDGITYGVNNPCQTV